MNGAALRRPGGHLLQSPGAPVAAAPCAAQQGQVLALAMLLAGAVALAFVRYFDTGMVVAAKARQDHALDAAAYSGALVQARALNMLSYINRAQVAHQVAMAHLVTLGSLAHFAGAEASRAAMANPPAYVIGMHFGANHAQAYLAALKAAGLDYLTLESGPLASAYAEHDRVSRSVLSNVSAQIVAGMPAAREQAMREVLAANYPAEPGFDLRLTDDNFDGFLAVYAGNPNLRPFVAEVSALYGFLGPRDHTAKSPYPPELRCPSWRHELRRRGVTVLDQGGRWQAIDTQSYHSVRYNRWIGCYFREYAMGWGWVPPRQSHLIDTPHVAEAPENFANQDFWRWVREATNWDILGGNANPLANSWAFSSRRQWAGGGLPVFHDLAATHHEASAYFRVALRREGRAGIHLHSSSAAEAFFRRPQPRTDGRRELPGTFHPYWQARLRAAGRSRNARGCGWRRDSYGVPRHKGLELSPGSSPATHQAGQALVEALIASFALAVLWVAIHWLAHYQDMALSAVHASRHSAFESTRVAHVEPSHAGPGLALTDDLQRHFLGNAHRWVDRRGQGLLVSDSHLQATWSRLEPLPDSAQPGRASAHASTLRRDFALADSGVLRAEVRLSFGAPPGPEINRSSGLLGLAMFEQPYPSLQRSISILTGAGHAATDGDVQDQVAASSLAWASAYGASRSIGETVVSRAEGVDDAWGRDAPTFDWLHPWAGRVPPHLLTTYGG